MVSGQCVCGAEFSVPESAVGEAFICGGCKGRVSVVGNLHPQTGGDELEAGRLVVEDGPADKKGRVYVVGGADRVRVGSGARGPTSIRLKGSFVAERHCEIVPPGAAGEAAHWTVIDAGSDLGVYVNGERIQSAPLRPGDRVMIGEYELTFETVRLNFSNPVHDDGDFLFSLSEVEETLKSAPVVARAAAPVDELLELADAPAPKRKVVRGGTSINDLRGPSPTTGDGPECPGCRRRLPRNAKICVNCGINIQTGRSLVTSRGVDENNIAVQCENWIPLVSWVVPIGFYPVASEAFGKTKPYVIWATAVLTAVISLFFLFAYNSANGHENYKNLMLWTGREYRAPSPEDMEKELDARVAEVAERQHELEEIIRNRRGDRFVEEMKSKPGYADASTAEGKAKLKATLRAELEEENADENHKPGSFNPVQLLSNAFLHDPSGVLGFLLHFGGNLLFMLVLGSGVNSVLGTWKTAVVYPVLAICASLFMVVAHSGDAPQACLGASGAVMGLAGMYLVFFPVHTVHVARWIKPGLLWRTRMSVKAMRGFWIVLFYIAFDVVAVLLSSKDGVAHWAHVGGFVSGVAIALGLLVARQVDAGGGDLLSAVLGKRAWALIGKPGDRGGLGLT